MIFRKIAALAMIAPAVCFSALVGCGDAAQDPIDVTTSAETEPIGEAEPNAADVGAVNVSVDPGDNDARAPTESGTYCAQCWVQCMKPDGSWGNPYNRGTHNDCGGTAAAFCWDKWGYTGSTWWCG